jgi:nitroreductase
MEFSELIERRYSVRAYKSDPVEDEKLQKILESARFAPTAANRQPFQLIIIHVPGREEELKRVYHREWFTQAPLIICACGVPFRGWTRNHDGVNYTMVDVAIVMDHIIYTATSLGLGTCWIANFDPQAAREVLGLPNDIEPIAFTPLGYPADVQKSKVRKPLSELVRYERW